MDAVVQLEAVLCRLASPFRVVRAGVPNPTPNIPLRALRIAADPRRTYFEIVGNGAKVVATNSHILSLGHPT